MQKPIQLDDGTIDAANIVAISDYQLEKLRTATGTMKNYTVQVRLHDGSSKNIADVAFEDAVRANSSVGLRFQLIDDDRIALRQDPAYSIQFRPFGARDDMPEENRRFFSQATITSRFGKPINIWLVTPYEKLVSTGRPAVSFADLLKGPARPAANGNSGGVKPPSADHA